MNKDIIEIIWTTITVAIHILLGTYVLFIESDKEDREIRYMIFGIFIGEFIAIERMVGYGIYYWYFMLDYIRSHHRWRTKLDRPF